MKKTITTVSGGLGLLLFFILHSSLFTSCDHIDEDERLIYVKPADVAHNVLIEDFTGQRCVNCPTATQAIATLQEAYGKDKVVAVAIHSGPFSRSVRGVPYPLATDIGEEYYQYWKLDHQPVGIVNRKGTSDYSDWPTLVYEELAKSSPLRMSLHVEYNETLRKVDVSVKTFATIASVEGKLQLWLTEDDITAFQYMPDGTTNQEYVHKHVFRSAVNGTWGTDFTIEEGEEKEENFSYTISEEVDWKPEHMHVVAFVFTDNGVEQVVTEEVRSEEVEK